MSKKNKILIIVAVTVVLAIIILVAVLVNLCGKQNIKKQEQEQQQIENVAMDEDKKYTTEQDGIKINTSQNLKKAKQVDGLDITNLALVYENKMTTLTGIITNNTNSKKGDYIVNISLLNSKEQQVTTMGFYIKELKPGESTKLYSSITFDYTNVYDVKIEK